MPFQETSVGEARLRFVQRVLAGELSVAGGSREYGISRQTGHKWLSRYRAEGAGGVFEGHSRRPHHSPARTEAEIEQAVVALRKERPDWGAPKLRHLFLEQKPDLSISRSTVHRILLRHNLVRKYDSHTHAKRRFEREAPNQLWQMDFKGPKGFPEQHTGPLSVLDDHSRFLITLERLEQQRVQPVRDALIRAFQLYGVPDDMLMDHGTPWWNANSPQGWTELTVWLMRQGIRVRLSGFRHPQTQGKVERMHGALVRALLRRNNVSADQAWLDAFRAEYNHVRPHESLGMKPPATRWQSSARQYQATPPPWKYESDCEVLQVDDRGRIQWGRHQFDVSRALKGEYVGVKPAADRALVYFCTTPVKAIDLSTGECAELPGDPFRVPHARGRNLRLAQNA